ncbi:MAG: class IIb bacteriocin, lactobin A/cerein 7B family [Lacunisphaera sp.]|nr:class IIb bacteriocin, lactobin A/cerein 7B family [Lacunisphaera sp.]
MAELSAEEMSNIQGGLSVVAVIAIIVGIGVAASAIGNALATAISSFAESVQDVLEAWNKAMGGGEQNQQ